MNTSVPESALQRPDPGLPAGFVLPPPPPGTGLLGYMLVLLGGMGVAMAAIVLVTLLRPLADNTALYATIVGFATSSMLTIAAVLKLDQTNAAVRMVHIDLNSRLTQWQMETAAARDAALVASQNSAEAARHAADAAVASARNRRTDLPPRDPSPDPPGPPVPGP